MEQKKDFRVIIAGTRDFSDYGLLKTKCDNILFDKSKACNITVVSGTARGADRLGERYARERGYRLKCFPADWDRDGNAAGPIRNAKMADNADALIAFWDGNSRGTQNMIETATEKNLAVRIINYPILQKWNELLDFSKQHATGHGLQTGFRWLQDSFHEYLDMSDETPGYGMGGQPGSRFNREVLAGKIILALGNHVGGEHLLDDDQTAKLRYSLNEIVNGNSSSRVLNR